MMAAALFFFLRVVLAIWGLLLSHTNYGIVFFIFVNNVIGILIAISLTLYLALDSTDILMT